MRPLLGASLVLGAIALAPLPALAFDTGHHHDLMREVMGADGFDEEAIALAQSASWLSDYLSTSFGPTPELAAPLALLHADNLFSEQAIATYWDRLAANTREAVIQAAHRQDERALIAALGLSLHAAQDFYSHSNWVETHPRPPGGAYRADTWYADPDREKLTLTTGFYHGAPDQLAGHAFHGGYANGLNKDSYVRQGWDEAYVFADAASREWLRAVGQWVALEHPMFWRRCHHWHPSAADAARLAADQRAAYDSSKWVSAGVLSNWPLLLTWFPSGADGHWKGDGSGSFERTALHTALQWHAKTSLALEATRPEIPLLVDGLALEAPIAHAPRISPLPHDHRVVVVRTLAVSETRAVPFLGLDLATPADFFARIRVNASEFIESTQQNRHAISPAWTTMAFVPADQATVTLDYALWDEDQPDRDDLLDITGDGPRSLSLAFDLGTQRLCDPAHPEAGAVCDTPARAFHSHGREADVRFCVSAHALVNGQATRR